MMMSNRITCRTIWVMVLASVVFSAGLQAQTIDAAHRKLERPAGGSPDVQRQIELLKRLQSLMQNRKQQSADNSEGLSPLQKSMMESVLKHFQNTEKLPDISNLPPELLSEVMSDPKARQDARDILEKFNKERQLPEPNGTGGLPLPPSDRNANKDPSKLPRPQNGSQNSRRSDSNGKPFNDSNQSPKKQNSGSSADRNDQRQLNRPGDRNDSRKNSVDPRQQPAEEGEPPIRMPGETESEYFDRYSEFVEREIQRQRQSGDTKPLDASELPSRPQSREQPGPRSSGPGSQQQRQPDDSQSSPGADDDNSNPSSLPPTISDLLKELENLPSIPSDNTSPNSNPASGNPRSSESNNSRPSNAKSVPKSASQQNQNTNPGNNDAESVPDNSEELARRKDELKKELDRSGLKSTLQKIVRDARQQIKDKPAAAGAQASGETGAGGGALPEMSSGIESAIIRSLDSLGKKALELAKEGKLTAPKSGTNSPAEASRPSARADSVTTPQQSNSSWGKKASDFISDVVSPKIDTPKSPSTSSAANDSPVTLPSVELPWMPFLILGCVALLMFAFAVKTGVIAGDSISSGRRLGALSASGLKTREDVVKAFHELALKPGNDAQAWWTHQQFKQQLKTKAPSKNQPIEVLAEVYEQARYLPDDSLLNEHQLEEARVALRRCES